MNTITQAPPLLYKGITSANNENKLMIADENVLQRYETAEINNDTVEIDKLSPSILEIEVEKDSYVTTYMYFDVKTNSINMLLHILPPKKVKEILYEQLIVHIQDRSNRKDMYYQGVSGSAFIKYGKRNNTFPISKSVESIFAQHILLNKEHLLILSFDCSNEPKEELTKRLRKVFKI
ncbi:hypothetical protein ABD87_23055 [Lysinibacillus sphaericus]|uniref:hypothetical protein n=1 Tax=Lysinibacillus sphaericus TaxID=1421 RepID=UPI0018CDE51D|nr:hypothetical protein [Lysinibacillus sphaericus]MBG9732306.1 hypothetical protein [Lysinibacillus sphaericus]